MDKLPDAPEFASLVERELASSGPAIRDWVATRLKPPERTTLRWEYGGNEPHEAWIFLDMGERGVVAAYCRGGHGALGSPWGLLFRGDAQFGADYGWYPTLAALVGEWLDVPGDDP